MPNVENLKKQAKQLVRWHRERNYSVAARIRAVLPRYRGLSDADILARPFALGEAQLLLAREAGFETWAGLTSGAAAMSDTAESLTAQSILTGAEPQLFVADIKASCAFFEHTLGFSTVFTHGEPPFYGQVMRDQVRLNLRFVCEPVFIAEVREREQLLAAAITVADVKALYAEFSARGADFQQPLKRQPWGAQQFVVRDPDGNLILFSGQ
ncbi:VOC family protein [Actinopolymorpha sp. B11F2]|uniref:bleomycin resistance protein n=1 Tax=Actinopolymorpha sp. B11F2 TaxID=3160862 RepID=UPI0032E39716